MKNRKKTRSHHRSSAAGSKPGRTQRMHGTRHTEPYSYTPMESGRADRNPVRGTAQQPADAGGRETDETQETIVEMSGEVLEIDPDLESK